MNKRGKYIVIEGNDGTGKSTQVARLAEYLEAKGHRVCVVEEPGSDDLQKSTPVANELRRLIKKGNLKRHPEINLALFSAARRDLWLNKIQPALASGQIVIAARNYLSTLAYQGGGEGLDAAEIRRMTLFFTDEKYLQPDFLIVLSLDDTTRAERIASRGVLDEPDTFESNDQAFQARVNHAYEQIAKDNNWPLILSNRPVEAVHQDILQVIGQF